MALTDKQAADLARRRAEAIDPGFLTEITVAVYKDRLEAPSGGGPGAVERMLEKDGDDGAKLASRARAYEPIVKATLQVLAGRGVAVPRVGEAV